MRGGGLPVVNVKEDNLILGRVAGGGHSPFDTAPAHHHNARHGPRLPYDTA